MTDASALNITLPKNPDANWKAYVNTDIFMIPIGGPVVFWVFVLTLVSIGWDVPLHSLRAFAKGAVGFFVAAYVVEVAMIVIRLRKIGSHPTTEDLLARPEVHHDYLEAVAPLINEADLLRLAQAMAKGSRGAQNLALQVIVPAHARKALDRDMEETRERHRANRIADLAAGRFPGQGADEDKGA